MARGERNMITVATGYRGGTQLDYEIVGLMNKCNMLDEPWSHRKVGVEEIRRLWFKSTWYNPSELGLLFYSKKLVGYCWAMKRDGGVPWIGFCVDPQLPDTIKYNAVETCLSWARWSFDNKGIRGKVFIGAGYEHGYQHRLLRRTLTSFLEKHAATLMVLEKAERKQPPPGYRIRRGGIEDVEGIVKVYNEAFSKYEWFVEWRLEDAKKWYRTRKLTILVAETGNGEIVGYVDAEIRQGLDGSLNAYLHTLAVKPEHQRRGLGGALLSMMAHELWGNKRVERIYLDSVAGLETFYGRLGFKIWRRATTIITPIPCLPKHSITYSNPP